MRSLTAGLVNPILVSDGLWAALEELAESGPAEFDLTATGPEPPDLETCRTAYLVVSGTTRLLAETAAPVTVEAVTRSNELQLTVYSPGWTAAFNSADMMSGLSDRVGRDGWFVRPRARPRTTGGGAAVRVVICDDTMLVRSGLARLLTEAGVDVVAELPNAESLAATVRILRPDVVIVDIRMPPTHTDEGLVAAQTLRENHPDLAVLVLSQYLEARYAERLLRAQPSGLGYLLKERVSDIRLLLDALERLIDGECVLDPTIVARLMRRRRNSLVDDLTSREREVLALMAEGRSNAGIARQLFLSERTVEANCADVFRKLRLIASHDDNRRVLAVLALLTSQPAAE